MQNGYYLLFIFNIVDKQLDFQPQHLVLASNDEILLGWWYLNNLMVSRISDRIINIDCLNQELMTETSTRFVLRVEIPVCINEMRF